MRKHVWGICVLVGTNYWERTNPLVTENMARTLPGDGVSRTGHVELLGLGLSGMTLTG